MHVVIVGGGIGGLALAQGLRRQNVSVEVHERDAFNGSRWEGYRIDIEEMGLRALQAVLPHDAWEQLLASSHEDEGLQFLTSQLQTLLEVDQKVVWPSRPGAHGHLGVDRPTLKRQLFTGLDDIVRFGAEFVRYEREADGRVTAHFADGVTATGDVLIGADGVGSRVAAQYLPQGSNLIDTGIICVGHKLWLTDETRRWLPRRLTEGVSLILSQDSVFGFNAVFDPPAGSGVAPYILSAPSWSVADTGLDPAGQDPDVVDAMVEKLTASWHPILRRVFAESDPTARAVQKLRYSPPREPWAPSNIVLLGDAVHTMPPTAGRGGNTTLRDAHLLSRMLGAAAHGRMSLLDGVGRYEKEVRDYGYKTVAESVKVMRDYGVQGAVNNIKQRAMYRAINALPPLRDRLFAGPRSTGALRYWETGDPLLSLAGAPTPD